VSTDLAHLSIEGSVAVLRLNDPRRRNVLSQELVAAIGRVMDEAESTDSVRSVVVTGAGSAFCAGAELETLARAAGGEFDAVRAVYDGFLRILHSPLLTIAAVNGQAVGAGLNLALACDVRLGSDQAHFDSRFAQLGLHPGGGHMWLMQRAVGYQQAALACLMSRAWDAQQALAVGLIASVHSGHELVDAAVSLAASLEGQDVSFARRMINNFRIEYQEPLHERALATETAAQKWSTEQPAFVDGVASVQARVAAHRRSREPR
jgi:enoyl-CoA hydratase